MFATIGRSWTLCQTTTSGCKPLPTLEDANSIQVALANVIERLIMLEIDHKTAALMLYALQIASMNLKRTSLEPELPTQVVIDRESVANRPIGASAWSRVEGREYDDLSGDDLPAKKTGLVVETGLAPSQTAGKLLARAEPE